jgi:thiol-disulfide isomerase/thioredoxin
MSGSADIAATEEAGRRRAFVLYASVGAAAAVAGGGLAWWKWSPTDTGSDAAGKLWGMSFDTPTGSTLAMQTLRGRPLLINFWATWCPPCVEELPLLDGFYKQNSAKSWQVLGLAIDQPSSVRTFLQRTPVSFPVGLAGLGGTELSKALGNSKGGLPFTVVLGSSGTILQRRIGRVTAADLAQWALLR